MVAEWLATLVAWHENSFLRIRSLKFPRGDLLAVEEVGRCMTVLTVVFGADGR
jgi:hypothetical protein